jgi:hypothetical protein
MNFFSKIFFIVFILIQNIEAHPLSPLLFQVEESKEGILNILWKRPETQVRGVKITPVFPKGCQQKGKTRINFENKGIVQKYQMVCENHSLVGQSLQVTGLDKGKTNVFVYVTLKSGVVIQDILTGQKPILRIPKNLSSFGFFKKYLAFGFYHLLTGPDHLLFVFGLIVLLPHFRSLLMTITFFTIGHSMTLGLSVLGIFYLPSGLSEVLIAFTLLLLAAEMNQAEKQKTLISKRPWGMSLLFGLIHGFGFAGALKEVGLPQTEIPFGLFSFNLGIECGQIIFIFCVLQFFYLFKKLNINLPPWVQKTKAYSIGAISSFLILERIF